MCRPIGAREVRLVIDRPLLEGPPAPGSVSDTFADKAVRFAIGAGLASLALMSLVLAGVGEGLGLTVVIAASAVCAALAGGFSITHGERFVEQLGRFIKWLA